MEDIIKVQLGDIGTVFRTRILDSGLPVDLQTCTDRHIIFKKPDDSVTIVEADFYTNGSDGYIQYTTTSGFLDLTGMWRLQGQVVFSGLSWHTNTDKFLVLDNLEEI